MELKKILYDAVIPKWHSWTKSYPLSLDNVVMRDHNWVMLAPRNPDRSIITAQFFKPAKKGALVFKAGRCIINLHILNNIYQAMLAHKEVEMENDGTNSTSMAAADFTVSFATKRMIFYDMNCLIS